MANSKKDLEKQFSTLIVNILDKYDNYSDEDKNKVSTQLNNLIELNENLNKYDREEPKWLIKLKKSFLDFFGG
jgi:hypothetical protein